MGSQHPLTLKPRKYSSSTALVIFAVGITGSILSGVNAMQKQEELLLSRTITAAGAIPAEDVRELSGDKSDLENPTYSNVKRRLVRIRQENSDMRSMYLYGRQPDGDIFYYVNSETEGSNRYISPGQLNPDAPREITGAFVEDKPFVEKLNSDGYGTWISAVAPVVDEGTGEIEAVLGAEISTANYFMEIFINALIPLLLAAIPLAVLLRGNRFDRKDEEIINLKTQVVSIASHELRSPITGALWGVQSLLKQDENFSDKQRKMLSDIYNSTATSLATVNEVLDFSVFERDKAENLKQEEVDLKKVLHDIKKVLILSAMEAKSDIQLRGDWPDKIMVIGDPGSLKRAFSNIVSNAIKYNKAYSVVEIFYEEKNDKHLVKIKDQGIGIPASELDKVMAGYYRASNASQRLAHGTGLGLWITNALLKQHDGKLKIDSKLNKGTTVFVTLPKSELLEKLVED